MADIQLRDSRQGHDSADIVVMQAMPGVDPQAMANASRDGCAQPAQLRLDSLAACLLITPAGSIVRAVLSHVERIVV